MLLHRKGKLTIAKSKSSRLSYSELMWAGGEMPRGMRPMSEPAPWLVTKAKKDLQTVSNVPTVCQGIRSNSHRTFCLEVLELLGLWYQHQVVVCVWPVATFEICAYYPSYWFVIFRHTQPFFQLYDVGQFLLVEERTQIHHTMYLGRDNRPSTSKMTNFFTVTSIRAGFEPTRAGGERPRGMRQMSWPLDHGGLLPSSWNNAGRTMASSYRKTSALGGHLCTFGVIGEKDATEDPW
jgi:hypothetical protein